MLKPLFLTGGAVSALLVASFVPGFVHAQSPAQAGAPPQVIDRITVTATPLGEDELNMAQPAAVLNGEELRRKRAGTIGDTLAQELGIQSSYFGPGSGRPVIRGLEAPRVLVLQDGIGSMDVSSISPDHGVTVEWLNATQIEILRGPATLLYGSGAIGGLVNLVTNRVPRYVPDQLTGNVELRGNIAARERSGGFNLDGAGAAASPFMSTASSGAATNTRFRADKSSMIPTASSAGCRTARSIRTVARSADRSSARAAMSGRRCKC